MRASHARWPSAASSASPPRRLPTSPCSRRGHGIKLRTAAEQREIADTRRRFHDAMVAGDLDTLRELLGSPPDFPDTPLPMEWGVGDSCLGYALAHAPLAAVRALLGAGADPNREAMDGFTSLISVIAGKAPDRAERLALILAHGADLEGRGLFDYTPLLFAAAHDDIEAVDWLLAYGADPAARTRIDECETALEMAERAGFTAVAERLRTFADKQPGGRRTR